MNSIITFDEWGGVPWDFEGVCFVEKDNAIHHIVSGKKVHRENGPAIIHVDDDGWQWWTNNKIHRIGGPAVLFEQEYRYYINDIYYLEEEYWRHHLLIEYKLNMILKIS